MINGAMRQVMLSAREINSTTLPNRTWVNERLTFTHGYGLTLGPVNQVTSQGLPVLYVRDLPPVTSAGLQVTEPSIYFGELSNDYVIVRTNAREFHYPTRGGRRVHPLYRLRRRPDRIARRASCSSRPGSAPPTSSSATRSRPRAGSCSIGASPTACGRWREISWPSTATRTWSSSTAASTGCTTPTRRATVIRTPRPRPPRSTTSATPSSSSSTPTTARRRPTWRTTSDPIAATYARIFPGLFKPLADMPAELRRARPLSGRHLQPSRRRSMRPTT